MTGLALLLILTSYAVAFFLPVVSDIDGWDAFYLVTVSPFSPGIQAEVGIGPGDREAVFYLVAAFANPTFWLTLVFVIREQGRLVLTGGLLAFAFGLTVNLVDYRGRWDFGPPRPGYYLWLAALLGTALFGAWLIAAGPPDRAPSARP